MLKMTVKVKIDDHNGGLIYKDFPAEEIRFKKTQEKESEREETEELSE